MNHIERALDLAEKYQKLGKDKEAEKFFKIAEKYEYLINKQREEDEKKKQKELYS